ncbi:isoprenoid synthase domain-containing protein [Aspergillus flavus]|nr:isoprenoid synthase domain-containing protein [Aspergillus flavus]
MKGFRQKVKTLIPRYFGNRTQEDGPSSFVRVEESIQVDIQSTTHTDDEKEKILTGPLDYLRENLGKDIRSKLIDAFNEFLEVPNDKLDVIKRIIDLLHNASLLIDDIQDSSTLRRGVPVAHSIFGVAQTINSANYAYFIAQRELTNLTNQLSFSIYTEELIHLHRGQGMELHWRDTMQCPSEVEYIEMALDKTGGLFRLAIRLMQAESASGTDYVPLVETLGLLFQIKDDYQNLQSDTYSTNKGFCDDIGEGKFSYPIIHSIRSRPGDLRLLSILKQRSEDITVRKYAVEYIDSTGSFDYCERKITSLMQQAREQVRRSIADTTHRGSQIEKILNMLEIDKK